MIDELEIGIMPFTNSQTIKVEDKRAALSPLPGAASGDGKAGVLPRSFRPAGRGTPQRGVPTIRKVCQRHIPLEIA
jgi:hypothetical protein